MRRCKQYDSISKKIMENTKLYKFKNTIDDIERISTKNIGVIGSGKIGKLILKKSSMFLKMLDFMILMLNPLKLSKNLIT